MSKRVVLISKTAVGAKNIKIDGVNEELNVTWDQASKYLSGFEEYEALTGDKILKLVRMFKADYIAVDIPMFTEQLEELLYALEKTDAILLEKDGSHYSEVVITA